jgi:hypothetical protein
VKLLTGLKWHQLRHWRRINSRAPVCVSLNDAPKIRYPTIDFAVGIDGGAFGKLSSIGKMTDEARLAFLDEWANSAEAHAHKARKAIDGLGRKWVEWVGPQDWMCEQFMLDKTGLTVEEHQRRTVANYVELCRIAPDVPWLPVIQGYTLAEYLRCVEMYRSAGVDLTEVERVGIGSVCRRQATREGVDIIVALLRMGIRVHAFGFKLDGLKMLRTILTDAEWSQLTADSAAWSKHAWKGQILMPGHYHGRITKNCANCTVYADARRVEIEASL